MRIARVALAAGLALWAGAAGATETLHYHWRLDGLLGALAGLFVPRGGEGELTLERLDGGRYKSELVITARQRAGGDYFLYGAEWEPASGTTVRAWSSSLWRGERKTKRAEVDQAGVVDIATAIHALRRDPPTAPRRLEIWSDGKLYPVVVEPAGTEERRVGGEPVRTRRFSVRGVESPGRRLWKGELDLWLAEDPSATPVEILVVRSAARVRLELVTGTEGSTAATAPRGERP